MHGLLTVCTSVLPSASRTQRRVSRAVFTAVSTGSTINRGGLSLARSASHLPLDAVEYTTGVDASAGHRTIDSRFESARGVSEDVEDSLLTVLLSTSQLTAEYAELVDDSAERLCPIGAEGQD